MADNDEIPDGSPPPPPRTIIWTASGCSVAKPSNDILGPGGVGGMRKNEDRLRLVEIENVLLAAVADGAGSSGLYCGQWAQALLDNLTKSPIRSLGGLSRWMDGFWKTFATSARAQAAPFPAKFTKLVKEGSCSTLAACWMRTNDNGGVDLRWLGYGDSLFAAFQWQDGELVMVACNPTSLGLFDRAPYLLNWKDLPAASSLHLGNMSLPPGTIVVLGSDGLGQFILLRFLTALNARDADAEPVTGPARALLDEYRRMVQTGGSKMADAARRHIAVPCVDFAADLEELRMALDSEAAFAERVRYWHGQGLLVNDDATLILIDVSTVEDGEIIDEILI
ncbi:MAG: hypothetical protein HQL37_09045 [Alphaproteobacteria bacterium]|nr:hypothetical protein [Alphaproteobacteria bacterium]